MPPSTLIRIRLFVPKRLTCGVRWKFTISRQARTIRSQGVYPELRGAPPATGRGSKCSEWPISPPSPSASLVNSKGPPVSCRYVLTQETARCKPSANLADKWSPLDLHHYRAFGDVLFCHVPARTGRTPRIVGSCRPVMTLVAVAGTADFQIELGTVIPEAVETASLRNVSIRGLEHYSHYSYFVSHDDDVVIIDPLSRQVARVIHHLE
jgi:hypothetical protein